MLDTVALMEHISRQPEIIQRGALKDDNLLWILALQVVVNKVRVKHKI